MRNEEIFLADSATVDNLDALSRDRSLLDERRLLELDDIARSCALLTKELLDSGLDIYSIFSLISERLDLGSYPSHDGAGGENEDRLRRISRHSEILDRAVLTDLYLSRLGEYSRPIGEVDLLPSDDSLESITYVRNQLSDEAYDVLSQEFSHPTVSYRSSFRECAEALASGEVGYCLLPLLERGGTRIHAVADLIYRNDFKINAITPVFGSLGDADVKYALVSKHFTNRIILPDDDRYLELRVGSASGMALSDLLLVAAYFELSVFRADTVTLYDGDSDVSLLSLVLRSSGGEFDRILTYLALFAPDSVPVGIYKNLE